MNQAFDATQFTPQYATSGGHPVGMWDARIVDILAKPVKDKPNSGLLELTYETPVGKIKDNFNLWNDNPKAVEISQKQLSAVCHATGIFRLTPGPQGYGRELMGAQLKIEVGYQKGQEPTAENPTGGYVEVKKVFDRNGNEPGKTGGAAPQPQAGQSGGGWGGQPQPNLAQGGAPLQQNPQGGGWTAQLQNNAPASNSGWGNNQAQPAVQAQPQGNKPPWAS